MELVCRRIVQIMGKTENTGFDKSILLRAEETEPNPLKKKYAF